MKLLSNHTVFTPFKCNPHSGKQEHTNLIIRKTLEGIHNYKLSTWKCSVASAVGPGSEQLHWGLLKDNFNGVGYADDIALLINGKFLHKVSEMFSLVRKYTCPGVS